MKIPKSGHGEQVASSQIVSWRTDGLVPPEPLQNARFEISFLSGPKLQQVYKDSIL
jgi:hypothetical protein